MVFADDIYSLATGVYPILPPRNSMGSLSTQYQFSEDYRQSQDIANAPSLFQSETGTYKAYTLGNYVWNTIKTGQQVGWLPINDVMEFGAQFTQRGRTSSAEMWREAAIRMNNGIREHYEPEGPINTINPRAPIPPSLEETENAAANARYSPGAGLALGHAQQFDFIDEITGRGVNTTKSAMGPQGGKHGMYGGAAIDLRDDLDQIDRLIEEGQIAEIDGMHEKKERAVRYFEGRLGDWNRMLRLLKLNLDIDEDMSLTGRDEVYKFIQWSNLRDAYMNVDVGDDPSSIMQGLYGATNIALADYAGTGYTHEGAKTMTKQLLASPDIAFGAGGEERFPLGNRYWAMIYPFQINPNTLLYRRGILEGQLVYGRMSIMSQNVGRIQANHTSNANLMMKTFSNAVHHTTSTVVQTNTSNTAQFASHTTNALRLIPEVDIGTVGPAFADAIGRLIEETEDSAQEAAFNMDDFLTGFRSTWTYTNGFDSREVWAAPYLGILVESKLVGSD